MPIYYEAGGAQQGPVQEDDFKAMVAGGQMPADTMVWREGMGDWQPWRDFATATGRREAQGPTPARVAAGAYDSPNHFPPPPILSPAGTVICVECGGSFAEDEVARFGAQAVCASCKPLFVQRVRETGSMRGSAAGPVTVYATVTRRLAARFLDLFLVYLVPVALLAIFIIPPLPGAVGPAGITGARTTESTWVSPLPGFWFASYSNRGC